MTRVQSVVERLAQMQPGDERSMATLLPLVYEELRALATHYLNKPGENARTLQPTALVHEAYMKMAGDDKRWSGRDHFMAVAAIAMRQVLVDYSRRRKADKRGGGAAKADVSIDALAEARGTSREMRVLELDDLLTNLATADERAARAAEMRLFGGMDQDQIARVQGVSRATVIADWHFARAWLARKVHGADDRSRT